MHPNLVQSYLKISLALFNKASLLLTAKTIASIIFLPEVMGPAYFLLETISLVSCQPTRAEPREEKSNDAHAYTCGHAQVGLLYTL